MARCLHYYPPDTLDKLNTMKNTIAHQRFSDQETHHASSGRGGSVGSGRFLFFFVILLIALAGPVACTTVSPYAPSAGPTWQDIRADLTTPERIGQYLNSSPVTYRGEKPGALNHTQTPEETISTLHGDCEDYAVLITDALKYHGYEADIISVEAKTSGGLMIHAVAVYRDSDTGQWHYIHGYRFRGLSIGVSKGFDSQGDMARFIAEKMNGKLYQYFVMSPDSFKKVYDAMLN